MSVQLVTSPLYPVHVKPVTEIQLYSTKDGYTFPNHPDITFLHIYFQSLGKIVAKIEPIIINGFTNGGVFSIAAVDKEYYFGKMSVRGKIQLYLPNSPILSFGSDYYDTNNMQTFDLGRVYSIDSILFDSLYMPTYQIAIGVNADSSLVFVGWKITLM